MTTQSIRDLFANPITRRIEEVIKVDHTDDQIVRGEINEYVVTDAIRSHYTRIFDEYQQTPNKPHEGIAVWVSGFFGSGKSSFAKILGLSIANRTLAGERAADLFLQRTGDDNRIHVLLKAINERIPTHAVIFDVSTDRGIRSGNQTLTEIMYGLFLQSLGYAKDLDLSELEIALEESGQRERFEVEYSRIFNGREWAREKGKVAFALSQASRVLHSLDPDTYPLADSWVKAVKDKADITPGKLAERANELMRRHRPGHTLMFVVDEVGQFVARDVQKMLDLQAIVQNFGIRGRGRQWLVVTSQERLGELVSGLDDTKIELARLMDRFPLQVHLEPSDISEVTSRRVLAKNAAAQAQLGSLFDEHRGRLAEHTRLSADIRLPDLSRDAFVDLYPLLPYQIDLIIQVVSGLRTQGGASRHVGGANRTIIKLAQQLLINPSVNLADQPVGVLVRLDQVYDLVENNIGSEIRAKIAAIPRELKHPLAQPVAKVICLLQYVKSVHRNAENIAAALVPSVDADSPLASVLEALRELEETHKIRHGDDGYRIPTPAEDDWETVRNGILPKPGDAHRLYSKVLTEFWQPQPTHPLLDTKAFKAGLAIHGREVVGGDMIFQFHLTDEGADFESLCADLRTRSQQERKQVFWAVALTAAIDHEIVELYRSQEMLLRKERETRGEDAPTLIAEERQRQRRHQGELRRRLREACLTGRVFFRGHDRSPSDRGVDVGRTAAIILGQVLPDIFDRFQEAAAKPNDVRKGTDAIFTAHNLQGLPPVFSHLGLLRDEGGKTVFRVDSGPLKEVLDRIDERATYGETATGRYLTDEFTKEPFGWDFEVVRLLVLSLMRAEKVDATSRGRSIDTVTGVEAKDTFANNNLFRQASFRPRKGVEFIQLVQASDAFKDTFGKDVSELTAATIAEELRQEARDCEEVVEAARDVLNDHRLPGAAMLVESLGQLRAIGRESDENAISTFNASHRGIKDAVKRARELGQSLTETRLHDLGRARQAIEIAWPALKEEAGVGPELESRAVELRDLLERETFYRDLPAIQQHARAIELEYTRRFDDAQQARIDTYRRALDQLTSQPEWGEVTDEEIRGEIAAPLLAGQQPLPRTASLSLLRSERDACEARLRTAIRRLQEIVEGERLAAVQVQSYFAGGIETEEQLDAALSGLRDECARLIGAGKKVVVS
ncbi:BREX system P-loop protein BrxC [Actinoplanes flavus]|uniref:BREX system P-loop protein BrxC n=1 Tax=Actinoplanes flavus TaxID=2820290 RepID=A0ABS3UL22_9ACTN|nr:BREX system P-loop protein BrxC [Actinoplanes flavus]MBO3739492.1 BREX system P-loop protein BrxC [Actinoplanes flavus]